MGDFKVHNVRFFNYQPQAIHCLAYEKQTKKIALSRSDNSIEVWNLNYNPYQERVIHGVSSRSVEALVWCKERLFSTGLHGDLTEYDLLKQKTKSSIQASHGSCWCMGLNSNDTLLAVGTEQGYIILFSVNEYGIEFEKSLEKQEGRILCLSWHKSGDFIAGGSIDAIRIWNVNTGYAIQRILIGRTEVRKETIVWCIAFTEDFEVISGDSRGYVSFWNGKLGTQIDSFKSHQADVLALCIDENEEMVCAAGIDPRVVTFERISVRDDQKRNWTKTLTRSPHTHDVRALVFADNLLVSGGVDTYLSLLRISSNIRLLCSPMPQYPCIHIATEDNSLLLQYHNVLELWRLGTIGKKSEDTSRQNLQLSSNLLKLVELHSKNEDPIICSCISRNANWLAYSTGSQIRLFCVIMEEEGSPLPQVSLLKVRYIPPACLPGHRMIFTPDATKLIVAADDGTLQVIGVDNIQPTLLHTFISPSEEADAVHLLSITNDGKYLAVADHLSNIHVYNLHDYIIHCSLPVYRCQPSAMAFHPETSDLVVVYTDQKIVEYSLKSKGYTNWCRKLSLEAVKSWMGRKYPTLGITFDPSDKNILILNDDNLICIIHKDKVGRKAIQQSEIHSPAKKSRQHQEIATPIGFHYCHKYKHLVWFGRLKQDVVVAVEVNELALLQSLPPPLRLKKFGT